jgi:uncharacterized protein (DUF983 family)
MKDLFTYLGRGMRGLCPQCGQGKIYARWNALVDRCSVCDCAIQAREDETWFFMYISTAAITGVFIVGMFLIFPRNIAWARWLVAGLAIAVFVVTTGPRKGIAIALDYFVDSRSTFPRH